MRFSVKWSKQPNYLVKSVRVNLLFNFNLNGVAYFGSVSAEGKGINLAEVSIGGKLRSVQGTGVLNMTKTCKMLSI